MGGKISKFNHVRWFGKNHRRVIILGLQHSGKSTLTQVLTSEFERAAKPLPEIGCYKIKVDKLTLSLYDLKGDSQSKFFWRHHFEGSQGVVFVLDLTKPEEIEQAKTTLHELLADELLKELPFLVFANKSDKQEASEDQVKGMLEIREVENCRAVVGSALRKQGVDTGISWLIDNMKPLV